ncbi:MAG: hypothetical protein HYY06_31670 [Deltaproteobacteria bacterium]|nr:hypothetical protein [Deltaproteobacteria bacterium]
MGLGRKLLLGLAIGPFACLVFPLAAATYSGQWEPLWFLGGAAAGLVLGPIGALAQHLGIAPY